MAPFQGEEVVGPGVAGSPRTTAKPGRVGILGQREVAPGLRCGCGDMAACENKKGSVLGTDPFSMSPGQRPVATGYAFSASSCLRICASTAAMAVMFSTRREVALVVRMCAGLATPIRIGPIATPSVNTRTRL